MSFLKKIFGKGKEEKKVQHEHKPVIKAPGPYQAKAMSEEQPNKYPDTISESNRASSLPQQTILRGVQILESLNLLRTTKNIDTLKGRYEFLKQIYNDHLHSTADKRFTADVQKSIDHYKITFYERIIDESEMKLLLKPNHHKLRQFYVGCVGDCFVRYSQHQALEIDKLKKDDAKIRRLKKLIEVAKETRREMTENLNQEEIDKFYNKPIEHLDNAINQYLQIVSDYEEREK